MVSAFRFNSCAHVVCNFRLTDSSLKNLKHNFCVHPNGGWPGEGRDLVYWPGCSEERLKLDFFDLGKNVSGHLNSGRSQIFSYAVLTTGFWFSE